MATGYVDGVAFSLVPPGLSYAPLLKESLLEGRPTLTAKAEVLVLFWCSSLCLPSGPEAPSSYPHRQPTAVKPPPALRSLHRVERPSCRLATGLQLPSNGP